MATSSSDDSSAEIQRVRDNWLEAKEDHARLFWGDEYRRLCQEKLRLEQQRLHADLRRSSSDETEWVSHPLFSERVKSWTGAAVPYKQWGIYAIVLAGTLFHANAYSKMYHVMRAAKAAPDSEARALHKSLAWVSEDKSNMLPF